MGPEELVAADVVRIRIVRREENRGVPVEAILLLSIGGDGGGPLLLAGLQIDDVGAAALRVRVDQPRIARIDGGLEAVTIRDVHHVHVRDPDLGVRPARYAPRPVVLRAAINPVRIAPVDGDVVELTDGQVVDEVPVARAVVGEVQTAVVAEHHVVGMPRIDPESMMIDMDPLVRRIAAERLAAIHRYEERCAEQPDAIRMLRVDAYLAVVARARVDRVLPRPRRAAIGRAEDAATLVLNYGEDDVRIAARDVDADAARGSRRPRTPLGRP